MFRTPLVPLYSSYTETTLRLANAVLQLILNDGVLPCVQDNSILDYDKNRQFAWEEIGNSLLSGVIVSLFFVSIDYDIYINDLYRTS